MRVAVWREAARKLIGPRITELDELLAKEPDKAPELLERGQLLTDASLYDEALKDLERLVALKVDSPESHVLHGRVLAGFNRDGESLPHLNQAIDAGIAGCRSLRSSRCYSAEAGPVRAGSLRPGEVTRAAAE